ncbi:DUF397 domain-containing protein [Streptomyces sp. V3I7]|uniref:DUF397 domain-containing protein n=1 Tax=Streptomyces sp. V3I7 TaxID=3042278 RepID=UPI0027D85107|nr:DUF397 domain-containing protein [Streptomyces sp. V3I7]
MRRADHRASFSDGSEGSTCVEVAATPTTLHLRESDIPDTRLTTTPSAVAQLLAGIRSGALGS